MTAAELMGEGISLMVSGMGFVLLFLFILIFAIRLMSYLTNRFFPEPIKPLRNKATTIASTTANTTVVASSGVNDIEALRPIIVAAIAHHRRQHN
ncbi:oxaloacetate decarboxylase subunit gamma [Pasteurella testudinis]|nr:oxaloacetate decarboxylase subunit gamma [Pasteurella testudinis]